MIQYCVSRRQWRMVKLSSSSLAVTSLSSSSSFFSGHTFLLGGSHYCHGSTKSVVCSSISHRINPSIVIDVSSSNLDTNINTKKYSTKNLYEFWIYPSVHDNQLQQQQQQLQQLQQLQQQQQQQQQRYRFLSPNHNCTTIMSTISKNHIDWNKVQHCLFQRQSSTLSSSGQKNTTSTSNSSTMNTVETSKGIPLQKLIPIALSADTVIMKNKRLQGVIREGLGYLNSISSTVQKDSLSYQSTRLKTQWNPRTATSSSSSSSSINNSVSSFQKHSNVYQSNNEDEDGLNDEDTDDNDDNDDDENNNRGTQKSFQPSYHLQRESPRDDARRLSEQHRLFRVAEECLEEMITTKQSLATDSCLTVNGEAILLLSARLKSSKSRHADLYWTIPSHLLYDTTTLTFEQKLQIQDLLVKRMKMSPMACGMWMKRIYSKLSHYYAPKIRLKPASPAMMEHAMLMELSDHENYVVHK